MKSTRASPIDSGWPSSLREDFLGGGCAAKESRNFAEEGQGKNISPDKLMTQI
jgi:hypothetical protein